jgi:hypothetical protein
MDYGSVSATEAWAYRAHSVHGNPPVAATHPAADATVAWGYDDDAAGAAGAADVADVACSRRPVTFVALPFSAHKTPYSRRPRSRSVAVGGAGTGCRAGSGVHGPCRPCRGLRGSSCRPGCSVGTSHRRLLLLLLACGAATHRMDTHEDTRYI